ncbi:hypothetical protein EV421DRAFT_1737021 [Armillaria borealis]|uniref:Uncharacterized protein n=1 Tax=Armillaria borealis TaxID=47425 RepID=A0AA39MNS7_9AGAR|nr:hypothetical protein EV421DRAFT_1737021 [Armillaria borealis]
MVQDRRVCLQILPPRAIIDNTIRTLAIIGILLIDQSIESTSYTVCRAFWKKYVFSVNHLSANLARCFPSGGQTPTGFRTSALLNPAVSIGNQKGAHFQSPALTPGIKLGLGHAPAIILLRLTGVICCGKTRTLNSGVGNQPPYAIHTHWASLPYHWRSVTDYRMIHVILPDSAGKLYPVVTVKVYTPSSALLGCTTVPNDTDYSTSLNVVNYQHVAANHQPSSPYPESDINIDIALWVIIPRSAAPSRLAATPHLIFITTPGDPVHSGTIKPL